jgi:hypothetical protein
MDPRFLTPDAAAAAGLIVGIILGSLALNLLGAGGYARACQLPAGAAAVQSAPRTAGAAAPIGASSISQR